METVKTKVDSRTRAFDLVAKIAIIGGGLWFVLDLSAGRLMAASETKVDLLTQVLDLVKKFAVIGGGLWLVWGVIVLAGGLKDKNGPALQSGIWQIVGGGLIIAAAALFSSISV